MIGVIDMKNEKLVKLQQDASLLRLEGKYKETIEVCNQLLELGLQSKNHKSILTAHINNAASYYCLGMIEHAFQSIEAHVNYCYKYGDKEDQLNSYNVLFLLHAYNKEYEKAKETLTKSIALGIELKELNIVSNGYSNYSSICSKEENFDEALKMALLGLEAAEEYDPKSEILEFRVKLNIANAHIGLGNLKKSKSMIDEMIQDTLLDSFIREKTHIYDLQGRWFMQNKDYKNAFNSLSKAAELANSYNDINLLKEIHEKRMRLCELMEDIKTGFLVQQDYIALLHQLSEREISLEAKRLDVKLNISAVKRKADTDFLTGLYNRSYLESSTDALLTDALRNDKHIVCFVLDLDNFKTMNDTYGHLFGDEVIQLVSQTCLSLVREDDLVGRFGGDEFVIILKGISLEFGKRKAEQLSEAIRNLVIEKDGIRILITVSIGIADNLGGSILKFKEIFHNADLALYKAKKNGKNQVYI